MKRSEVLVVLAVVALAALPGRVLLNSRSSARSEAVQAAEAADEAEDRVETARRVEAQLPDWQRRHDEARANVPVDTDVDGLIDQLSAVATETGVVWMSGKPEASPTGGNRRADPSLGTPGEATAEDGPATEGERPSGGLVPTRLSIVLSAPDVGAIQAFLDRMAVLPRVVTLDGIDLSSSGDGNQVAADLDAVVYAMPALPAPDPGREAP